jgi:hypothetical protein
MPKESMGLHWNENQSKSRFDNYLVNNDVCQTVAQQLVGPTGRTDSGLLVLGVFIRAAWYKGVENRRR